MEQHVIGASAHINFPELEINNIPARVDTGARTSAIWATKIQETKKGLSFVLFGEGSDFFNGNEILMKTYGRIVVTSSTGHVEERYTVKLLVEIDGRRIRGTFTLANRASQVYPILIGRNILRGKFIVNVKLGKPLIRKVAK